MVSVAEVATFVHACEGEAVTKLTNEKIPYFNAPIYLENKTQIGKVEEIFGPINEAYFSVKMQDGIVASSYAVGDKFFIDPMKLLPLQRFLPQAKGVIPMLWCAGVREVDEEEAVVAAVGAEVLVASAEGAGGEAASGVLPGEEVSGAPLEGEVASGVVVAVEASVVEVVEEGGAGEAPEDGART
eukprot:jgi/Mesen1/4982/ME000248S04274